MNEAVERLKKFVDECGKTVDLKGFPVDAISYAENFVAGYDGEKHVTVDAEGLFSVCQAIVASARKE